MASATCSPAHGRGTARGIEHHRTDTTGGRDATDTERPGPCSGAGEASAASQFVSGRAEVPDPFSGTIALQFDGGGSVRGDATGTVLTDGISLTSGRVSALGALVVRTREAEVRPSDAPTDITRDALGTTVEGGTPEVRCLGHEAASTGARVCLPVSAEGLLARAAALRRTGDRAGEASTLDLAVTATTSPMVRAEALYQRGTLPGTEAARAIADLEAALAIGATARPDDLARSLARLYAGAGRCAAALPHLRTLETRGTLREDEDLLVRCVTVSDGPLIPSAPASHPIP